MSDMLSQEEINALLGDSASSSDEDNNASASFKNEILTRLESLLSARDRLFDSLKEKDSKSTPRFSDLELKKEERNKELERQTQIYEKAVEKYCEQIGISVFDYQVHEFYASRGEREHLPPEKLKP